MSGLDICVPDLPESVRDATVVTWYKAVGDTVQQDDVLVDIETDKIVIEIPAPVSGVLTEISQPPGAVVTAQQRLGTLQRIEPSDAAHQPAAAAVTEATEVRPANEPTEPPSAAMNQPELADAAAPSEKAEARPASDIHTPAVRRLLARHELDAAQLAGSGRGGRLTRADIEKAVTQREATASDAASARSSRREPMSRLRQRIAERLLEARQSTAMLTTFNEADMSPIRQLREQYGAAFEQRHGVRLGLMSFFLKAVVEALKRYPQINAAIDGDEIVYHDYFDISIAISTPRGLVTPVLRDVDKLSFADIEKTISALSVKSREGKLTVDELTGGNFTLTNGGVFGSLLSTPLINPPQSAILGMHTIQDRPVAIDGQVVIRPMMYLALSYDHRLIDGREAVGFLITVKRLLEEPVKLLLDL